MKLTTTQDKELNKLNCLLHSDSGEGKTTSLRTLPEDSTFLILSERSALPLKDKAFKTVRIDCWDDVCAVRRGIQGALVDESGGITFCIGGETFEGIKTLTVDSLSDINTYCIQHIVEVDRPKLTLERTRRDKTPSDKPDNIYESSLTQEDYGELSRRMMYFVHTLTHAPAHTIMTALTAWAEDKRTGIDRRIPAFHKSLAAGLPAKFDVVLHMETDATGNRVWRTAKDAIYACKDSYGVLAQFEEPDWTKLFTKIFTTRKGK